MAAAARHLDPGHQRLKVIADVPLDHLDLQGAGIYSNDEEHRFHGAGDLWLAECAKWLIVLQSGASATALLGPEAGPRYHRIEANGPLGAVLLFGVRKFASYVYAAS